MPRLRIVLVPVALLAIVACTLPPADRRVRDGDRDTADPPAASAAAREAAEKVNAFAADLYAQLRPADGNLIFSPYSVNSALAMVAAGARGETRTEMERVLHLPADGKFVSAYHAMTASVVSGTTRARFRSKLPSSELNVANSLWLQKGRPWKREYIDTVQDDFRAGIFDVNFGDAKDASGRINRWVERETHDRIKNLVPPDAIGGDTRMVLANAIYFKADWAESFKKEETKTEDFTLADGQKVAAPLMHQSGSFRLWETDGFQVLKLPYDGKVASMYVLLPKEPAGLPALERQLTAATLAEWTTVMNAPGPVNVWLPRFKFTVPTELAGILQQMGVKDAFDPQKANFRGMTESPEGLFISRVIHKAFVETDEVGTEAAAATALTMSLGAVAQLPPPPVRTFRADHPFLFVIKHEPTGAVLFMGRVLDPTR